MVPWSQTKIDGMRSAPVGRLEIGAPWSWHGDPISLRQQTGFDLRAGVIDAARQLLGPGVRLSDPTHSIETDRSITLSDGLRAYTGTLVDVIEIAHPLVLFADGLPPRDVGLRIVDCPGAVAEVNRLTEEPTSVICFTKGTQLLTPDGPRLVEDLVQGDAVLTKDDGPQDIHWIGSRRMSGARLHAMPELRPIRLRSGAINGECPDPDLVVSPRHRIVLKGDIARSLFGTPEVLVTAQDLKDDRGILVDHTLAEVTYVHILLKRHQIVWANGVETESFHPASTDLQTIEEDQRAELLAIAPGIESNPSSYGAAARKPLTSKEAAIFGSERGLRH